jgi:exopolysaccharide biosynthesis WecB/TagA/CpsF family protein
MSELLEKLEYGGIVFTPNVDHVMKLQKDREFARVYQEADYRICDSQLLMYAARFLGEPLKEKVSGSDLFPAFYHRYSDDPQIKIFLLGGLGEVAEKARHNINCKVGREIVIGSYSPALGFENDPIECQKIINTINDSGATVLAVGLGAPKQEKWIARNHSQLINIKTYFALGATIDFEAGCLQRSPKWMSMTGLEWLYRLLQEPKRLWKRYLIEDIPFFYFILQQKFNRQFQRNLNDKKQLVGSGRT